MAIEVEARSALAADAVRRMLLVEVGHQYLSLVTLSCFGNTISPG